MNSTPYRLRSPWFARTAASVLLAFVLAFGLPGCGGGGGSGDSGSGLEGSRETSSIRSSITGTEYPLQIYLPPASAGARAGLPVMYLLDGESWFEAMVRIVEETHARVIIVAVHTAGQRSRDFVPANQCTTAGGGHVLFADFIRRELIPSIERTVGGDPLQRTLFGHSHGGSFVLYAMFSEAPGHHTFKSYLASDSSISCMPALAEEWLQNYAAAYRDLPVRLHLTYATQGNFAANLTYSGTLAERHFGRLTYLQQSYGGSHSGIVPQVLADGLVFARSGTP